jgi:hypothetical protein
MSQTPDVLIVKPGTQDCPIVVNDFTVFPMPAVFRNRMRVNELAEKMIQEKPLTPDEIAMLKRCFVANRLMEDVRAPKK